MGKRLNRRFFLRGAAGFALTLPFLPSLLESDADAAEESAPRFIAFGTNHGGIWQSLMYPPDGALTDTSDYHGIQVRRGLLPLDVNSGTASLSQVLSADASVLTSALKSKMNVMRGLDVTFYLAHHRGGHLGNFADNDGNGVDGPTLSLRPTIDQVLAWSEAFYPDLASILERSLVIGGQSFSWGWSNPSNQSGVIQPMSADFSSLALFNKIFVPPQDPTEVRPPIVDRVIADYKRLRNGNRRLSAEDKRRLDDHLDRLDELERKLNAAVSCGEIMPPTTSSEDEWNASDFVINPAAHKRFWQLFNDVIVAAMVCDTSRIATVHVTDTFSTFSGDWHQDVAHQANTPSAHQGPTMPYPQDSLAAAHQRFFEDVFLDLVAKLDAVDEGNGSTLLDQCLVQWTQESGCVTHDPIEMPIITAGGACGAFTTGNYLDYRNLNSPAHQANMEGLTSSHTGLVYNQWLGNVLQAMGLDPSSYESGGYGGYGALMLSTEQWYAGYGRYQDGELDSMSEMLPFLSA